jgi:hypothetical protein
MAVVSQMGSPIVAQNNTSQSQCPAMRAQTISTGTRQMNTDVGPRKSSRTDCRCRERKNNVSRGVQKRLKKDHPERECQRETRREDPWGHRREKGRWQVRCPGVLYSGG